MSNAQALYLTGRSIAIAQAEDRKRSIPYRPEYNAITDSVAASIFLQQVWYWWQKSGRQPFYKFLDACEDRAYRPGDSWAEELGFTASQVDTARSKIAVKITKGANKKQLRECALVIYWTDSNRMTWYELNEDLFFTLVGLAYTNYDAIRKSEISKYLGKPDFQNALENLISLNLYSQEITSQISTKEELQQEQPVAPRQQKSKKASAPKDTPAVAASSELTPQTLEERVLFGLLQEAASAKGRRGPGKFSNPQQARDFRAAAQQLNGQTTGILQAFMRGGGDSLGRAVAYVVGAAKRAEAEAAERAKLNAPGQYVDVDAFFTGGN